MTFCSLYLTVGRQTGKMGKERKGMTCNKGPQPHEHNWGCCGDVAYAGTISLPVRFMCLFLDVKL